MLDDADFIIGLMKQEYEAVGFIPSTSIRTRYVPKGRYIIQKDTTGKYIGYLLHGALKENHVLAISQTAIDIDYRNKLFGQQVVDELKQKAHDAGCTSIRLRCAEDLDSNEFWKAEGFKCVDTLVVQNKRNRKIHVYTYDLSEFKPKNKLYVVSAGSISVREV